MSTNIATREEYDAARAVAKKHGGVTVDKVIRSASKWKMDLMPVLKMYYLELSIRKFIVDIDGCQQSDSSRN